jgi:oxygen-independent coproporphyrinogen-3 oxidase
VDPLQSQLIAKYDVASPRYTSYPTVPYWSATPNETQWLQRLGNALQRNAAAGSGLGLYVHLPF